MLRQKKIKGPCPKCREAGRDRHGDNLITYPDGGYHCFSCGHHKHGKFNPHLVVGYEDDDKPKFPTTIKIPIQGTANYVWLKKYGLTDQEIQEHFSMDRVTNKHFYSVKNDDGSLVYMEMRAVDGRKPKTKSYGVKPHDRMVFDINKYPSDVRSRLVLVEDIVSCIKVARHIPCMCLFGSMLSPVGTRFVNLFDHVTLWLDPDKYMEAIELSQQLSLFIPSVDVVYSEQDPKDYNDLDLKRYLL